MSEYDTVERCCIESCCFRFILSIAHNNIAFVDMDASEQKFAGLWFMGLEHQV